MTERALVLGGGGILGIAWMLGLWTSLAEAGVRLEDADLVVGTSAGSVVGTLVAGGAQPAQLAGLVQAGLALPPEAVAKVATGTGLTEEEWVGIVAAPLGGATWPPKPLRISAVDEASGEAVIWTRESGAPLARAIASSCAVPNLLPPVTINGRRYIDGGARSGTHADQALGCRRVLIIAPMGGPKYALGHEMLEKERAQLEAAGSRVLVVLPDARTEQVFGDNLMIPDRAPDAAAAGLEQGARLAEEVRAFWG
ncbi:MAG: patatin-like phospholipase family protein [Symbiobacterium sp.]|uniref:patatin-like phospholipase family protein n=1 Tax=Symbiobacterium sp. TaxID=1971213 RepID=UPI0034639C97